jgi:DNA mismatch repair protein MutS
MEQRRDDAPPEAAARITPMMEQYVEIRAANPDCLLFYRMGDFYELFFNDAEVAARALGIALTKRGRHLGEDIPMCGVPVHAADEYLQKLIALGHRVAVCEQTEDPAEARRRGSKALVRREVTRLVTPGTLTEDRLLEAGRSNFLAAIVKVAGSDGRDRHALAWTDISTGVFRLGECAAGGLATALARIEPREALVVERLSRDPEICAAVELVGAALTPLPAAFFDAGQAERRLTELFGVKTLDAFGTFSRAETIAGAALVAYLDKTQVAKRIPLEPPRRVGEGEGMRIDAATRANLELFRSVSGGKAGSLLAAVDRTLTAAGARLLAERLAGPSFDPALIADRLDGVAFFVERRDLRRNVREELARTPDIARSLSRLALARGGPRDLAALRVGLECADEVARLLASGGDFPPPSLAPHVAIEAPCKELAAALQAALADDLPILKRDGGFVRAGCDEALDEARRLRDESRRVIASLQARYAEATGIRSLKVRHNNVLGYFVETTAGQAQALLADQRFVHRQTLASAMRFSTVELAELEQKIATAAERALAIELTIFDALVSRTVAAERPLRAIAKALAEIDVAAANAELAERENYVRPKVDRSLAFRIEGGRHPVVEQALKAEGRAFIGNDCDLSPVVLNDGDPPLPLRERAAFGVSGRPGEGDVAEAPGPPPGRVWLLTGPNMAGKSTFLRQNALIAILAQAGLYVPARSAHIGVVDALFSRVGAADDLARGRSTFMVEMVETAAILNQAGRRALVILDEIGRGTATFDGLSIAWAAIEHLHDVNRSRALFATHYHELTALAARLPRLFNATMTVKEWKGDVVFLHEVAPGAADRSYGIQVAKLAGLPASVIARAREVLDSLEKSDRSRPKPLVDDLPLFAAKATDEPPAAPALAELERIQPDELSPKAALEVLYRLKQLTDPSQ